LSDTDSLVLDLGPHERQRTLADRTRRVYDRLAVVYPLSTYLFHTRAHKCALQAAEVSDGMRVLEVATGSGEMFRRLVGANPNGACVGVDLSPKMAQRTHRRLRREFPAAKTLCQAVDARYMPFRDESFDVVFCCYLLELLAAEDIARALGEIRRVLRPSGKLALVSIGQNVERFNRVYRIAGGLAPAFWGRQVARHVPALMEAAEFRVLEDCAVRQGFYPSRVVVAARG